MPRLSLYRTEKSKDYKFIDRTVYEQFQVGGTDVLLHKYLGPSDPSNTNVALPFTTIQDVLFLENRDRKYDQDIYTLRGHFQLQDVDFNLSQFGIFLQNDTLFLTVHMNNSVDVVGRKLMPGDVFEIPVLKDEYAANDLEFALKRFYVVDSITRAAEGYSAVWYPHLYRLKLVPITDSQEYRDILNKPIDDDAYMGIWDPDVNYSPGQTVKWNGTIYEVLADAFGIQPPNDLYYTEHTGDTLLTAISTYTKELEINEAVVAEAEANAPLSGYETRQFYTLTIDPTNGLPLLTTVDNSELDASCTLNASRVNPSPVRDGYLGYLLGDGIPANGEQFGIGIHFPEDPFLGDFFLRTDYLPNRLFRFDNTRWVKYEDNVRMTMSNTDSRQTLKTSFINNTNKTLLNPISSDTFIAVDPYVFNADDITNFTLDFNIYSEFSTVLTSIPYNVKNVAKVIINDRIASVSAIRNSSGRCEFDIFDLVVSGVTVNWTIYKSEIDERQGLSKVLKFRPEADI